MDNKKYILAFDTANESISAAIGNFENNELKVKAAYLGEAHRASNTQLLPQVNALFDNSGIKKTDISHICAGIGPGSFTGVRIALASAKGIATALNIPMIGVNTLDAIAWRSWDDGFRGHVYVVADAMRKEIYPSLYKLTNNGVERLSKDIVVKADKCADEAHAISGKCENLIIVGDALHKYFDLFEDLNIGDQRLWVPDGKSILLASNDKTTYNLCDAGAVLPVYTRLSDAEEGERKKLAKLPENDISSGVNKINDDIVYTPMSLSHIEDIVKLEQNLMGTDAWNNSKLSAELEINNRSWWTASINNKTIAYGGAMCADNNMELLKIAVDKDFQHKGIAKKILSLLANDMRNLAAYKMILEVRESNINAINFYKSLNMKEIHKREKYYSDNEAAILMQGPLPIIDKDVAGMNLKSNKHENDAQHPIIFAIESSCDETACAITCNGKIVSDVIASQVDFHKRFGGVVPEIASRKHIEAICGVAQECIEQAQLTWSDIDAIGVTFAPGLVGALVVGMAFAKGLSFALDIPLIGVNHLEGHLYANKIQNDNIKMPAVASLISGGNTMLVQVNDWGSYQTLGTTIDDAVGEAFDKVSKYLGLGYPGGPVISKLAKSGNPKTINFPRAMLHTDNYDFSLSGLKTAVITYIDKHHKDDDFNINDLCASFEQAIIDVQVYKAEEAITKTKAKTFMFGGGVAANPQIREAYKKMCDKNNVELVMAPLSACGDNAAMIALVAHERYLQNKFFSLDDDVQAHASLDEDY